MIRDFFRNEWGKIARIEWKETEAFVSVAQELPQVWKISEKNGKFSWNLMKFSLKSNRVPGRIRDSVELTVLIRIFEI